MAKKKVWKKYFPLQKNMEHTIEALKKEAPHIKVMLGGAVLTADYALKIGADYYSKDARGAVDIAKEFWGRSLE